MLKGSYGKGAKPLQLGMYRNFGSVSVSVWFWAFLDSFGFGIISVFFLPKFLPKPKFNFKICIAFNNCLVVVTIFTDFLEFYSSIFQGNLCKIMVSKAIALLFVLLDQKLNSAYFVTCNTCLIAQNHAVDP